MCENIWERNVSASMCREEFWSSIDVWVKKPHVVNRRLWGSTLIHSFKVSPMNSNLPWDPYRSYKSLWDLTEDQLNDKIKVLDSITNNMGLKNDDGEESDSIEINIVKLLPKDSAVSCVHQLVAKNRLDDYAFFAVILEHNEKPSLVPSFPYSFHYSDENITLKTLYNSIDESGARWLHETVLPQIVKWGQESSANESTRTICKGSLTLVAHELYYHKYNELKLKYGKEMVKIWPESTDPAKFVYEDVAIASYLLVLWGAERAQSFVDLGCGNGLLVHILAGEGHTGHGVDVRRRNIWSVYPDRVVLKEQTISPSDMHLFPDVDWIIGNHSDELTPWIPVIAARSSYGCKFFVLPCCCYNFNGSKYQRKDSSKSQYAEYLDYIHRLCERCGFKTSVDRLKIPSTKRICLVGTERTYPKEKYEEFCGVVQGFVDDGKETNQWISDFKPREATERVRNCTQIDKSLIESIVQIISNHLVYDCRKGDPWNKGKVIDLNEAVNLVSSDMLKSLKSECGGLQTLLKNNHQIFKVESGKVQLRYPLSVSEVIEMQKKRKSKARGISVKKKNCWFYNHHPQGCPLTDEDCSFVHSNENQ